MPKAPTSEADIKDSVFTLYNELKAAKQDKKETVKAHTENIKRIQDELDELIDDEEEDVKKAQKAE